MERKTIDEKLKLGSRLIDMFTTCVGARGRVSLPALVERAPCWDDSLSSVYVMKILIGERGREIKDFLHRIW